MTMLAFEKTEPEDGWVHYRLAFENDEYLVEFYKADNLAPSVAFKDLIYHQTQWRKRGDGEFITVNETVWSFAISDALRLIENLDRLEIRP
jgi:hypothetical protein